MKIKLDENLPEGLVGVLASLGHDVDNVRMEGFAGRDDEMVWRAAHEKFAGRDGEEFEGDARAEIDAFRLPFLRRQGEHP